MHEQGSSRSREKGEARPERQQPSRNEPDHAQTSPFRVLKAMLVSELDRNPPQLTN
jgi:hypothetical protein